MLRYAILCHCQFFHWSTLYVMTKYMYTIIVGFFFFLFVSSDRSSYGGPRASLRRQLDHKDVYGYQCFYKKPPTGSITLQQFEAYAIERLKGQTTMIVIYWQLHFSQSTKSIYFFYLYVIYIIKNSCVDFHMPVCEHIYIVFQTK